MPPCLTPLSASPITTFVVAEGYHHLKSKKKTPKEEKKKRE